MFPQSETNFLSWLTLSQITTVKYIGKRSTPFKNFIKVVLDEIVPGQVSLGEIYDLILDWGEIVGIVKIYYNFKCVLLPFFREKRDLYADLVVFLCLNSSIILYFV